ncbi:hypothetical protein ERJ75_000717300 [Trypanosoma vivax]|nr:hypothetical protein ERJ75_000717300 [Trypanosoma vivax]
MLRKCVGRPTALSCHAFKRLFCCTTYFLQRGRYGNNDSHGDDPRQRPQDNRGNNWGGPRGGGRQDYGDQGQRGNNWGGPRGGGRQDYGDQGQRGDWGGPRGGGRQDYGDQGQRGDNWGGPRGGGRQDYGDQGQRGNNWGGPRGGGRQDYGDQGQRGDWGGPRGGGRQDYGDQGQRGDWGGPRGGGRQDYGSRSEFPARGNGNFNSSGNADAAPMEPFNEQGARQLFELKRRFREAKTGKERREIQRDARRLIRRARVDPSTQDEKSVAVLLNCAATFRSYPHTEGIGQAVQWMRTNVDALSRQNIALFANAVGALWVLDSETILTKEISPIVKSAYKQMNPVELVMILQAFQRGRVSENASLQESMLEHLSSCIPQMPVSQLSTLASVLVDTPLRKSNEGLWQELCKSVFSRAVTDIDKVHSREAITLLKAAPHLRVSEEHSVLLVSRAVATARFHTDEQVGDLLESVANYRTMLDACGNELNAKLEELVNALWVRLQKVAPFADVSSATSILRHSRLSGVDVPPQVMEALLGAVTKELLFHRRSFRRLAALTEALAEQGAEAKQLLLLIGDYCIGKRPSREDSVEGYSPDSAQEQVEARLDIFSRFLGDLTRARIALENAYSANAANGELGESVLTLAKRLEEGLATAMPREVLKCVQSICTASDGCRLRNSASDEKLISLAEQRIRKDCDAFFESVRVSNMERFVSSLGDNTRAQKIVQAVSAALKCPNP